MQNESIDENQSILMSDICPNDTINCDGIRDCELGSDEMVCGECARNEVLAVGNQM